MKRVLLTLISCFVFIVSKPIEDENLVGDSLDINRMADSGNLLKMRNDGYKTIYIRAFDTYGLTSFDKSMAQTIHDAYKNNFQVELYMAPNSYSYKSGANQVQSFYDGLIDNQIPIDSLWVSVNHTAVWSVNTTANIALVDSVLHKARQLGFKKIGIFTNSDEWQNITGNWKDAGSDILLWYWSHTGQGKDGESAKSFDDFVPFGSWTQAEVKQYGVNELMYNTIVNRDIYNGSTSQRRN
ncbi:unnamed protein product [Caenorhabditis angaria]|uniref:Lysozyme n=1 Tax=Caenorhabditis angaria TaxID=860376 RepID=A0A9P1IS60_9PELO|nr:unnamed protein product [Caenorhabditis angaria]